MRLQRLLAQVGNGRDGVGGRLLFPLSEETSVDLDFLLVRCFCRDKLYSSEVRPFAWQQLWVMGVAASSSRGGCWVYTLSKSTSEFSARRQ